VLEVYTCICIFLLFVGMPLLPILVDVCQCICFFSVGVLLVCIGCMYISFSYLILLFLLACRWVGYCLYFCGLYWNTNISVGIGVCTGLYTGIYWMFISCFSYLVLRVLVPEWGGVWDWCCLCWPECFICMVYLYHELCRRKQNKTLSYTHDAEIQHFQISHPLWKTKDHHQILSWARWVQSTSTLLIYLRSILTLSSHLCQGLLSGLFFPSSSPTKIVYLSNTCSLSWSP
jgi:hypothetical protein